MLMLGAKRVFVSNFTTLYALKISFLLVASSLLASTQEAELFATEQAPSSDERATLTGPNLIADYINPDYTSELRARTPRKWTFMIYIAADNDLFYFAWNNIKQLAKGANPNVNIVVFLNEPGINKKTQIYLVEKNRAVLLNKDNNQKLDSGNPQTLIDFCSWTIANFPADEYLIDLWNHGTGPADRGYRIFNPSALFVLNPNNLMLELDRSVTYFGAAEANHEERPRGICFDETYRSYLDNQKLQYALDTICKQALRGRKISILGMDACLMATIEIGDLAERYADYLVASQEVELGPGWRYDRILSLFQNANSNYSKAELAQHMVRAYHETYSKITKDFTLSAVDLNKIGPIKDNINQVAKLLIECLRHQSDGSVKAAINRCRDQIGFEEPSYIDLYSFYQNLLQNLNFFSFQNQALNNLTTQLAHALQVGQNSILDAIWANTCGSNLTYAKGLSIYFPERGKLLNSYQKTDFAQTNQWATFIAYFDLI